MLSHSMEMSVFVKFIINFFRLLIGLRKTCFNYNLEDASVNVIKKLVLR